MEIFVKPNGQELPVNANSRDYAISLGWKPKAEKQEEAPKKRGRPSKNQE